MRHLFPIDRCFTLTVPEAANLLGISKVTLYRHARAGDVPCARIGHTVRIHRSWVEEQLGQPIGEVASDA